MAVYFTLTVPRCEECGGDVVICGGEYVCRSCGLVISPVLMPEARKDAPEGRGNGIRVEERCDKNVRRYVTILNAVCSKQGISGDVAREAQRLIRVLAGGKHDRGRRADVVLTALYLASLRVGVAVSLARAARILDEMGFRCGRGFLARIAERRGSMGVRSGPFRPSGEIARHAMAILNSLFGDEGVRRRAAEIAGDPNAYMSALYDEAMRLVSRARRSWVMGKSPRVLAACAVYLAEARMAAARGDRPMFTQRAVSEAAGVSYNTVRERTSEYVRLYGL